MGPADGVDDGADLLHVAVFANRSVEVGGLEELFLWDASDAFDHLRRVARIVFLQELEHAVRILQRWIKVDSSRQRRKGGGISRRSPGNSSWLGCRSVSRHRSRRTSHRHQGA